MSDNETTPLGEDVTFNDMSAPAVKPAEGVIAKAGAFYNDHKDTETGAGVSWCRKALKHITGLIAQLKAVTEEVTLLKLQRETCHADCKPLVAAQQEIEGLRAFAQIVKDAFSNTHKAECECFLCQLAKRATKVLGQEPALPENGGSDE